MYLLVTSINLWHFLAHVIWNSEWVNLPICMVTYSTSFYPPVIRILLVMLKSVILYLIIHYAHVQLPFLANQFIHQIKCSTEGIAISVCLTSALIWKILLWSNPLQILQMIFINNMLMICVMFLKGMHHLHPDWQGKILQVGCLILKGGQSPLGVSLKTLAKSQESTE